MEIGGRWSRWCCCSRFCCWYFRLYCTHFRLYLFHQRCNGLDVRLQLLRNAHQWAQIVAQEAQLCQLKSYKLSISNFHSQQKWHIHMTLLPQKTTKKKFGNHYTVGQNQLKSDSLINKWWKSFFALISSLRSQLMEKNWVFFWTDFCSVCKNDNNTDLKHNKST